MRSQNEQELNYRAMLVACCVLVIAAISVHDAALVVMYDEVIAESEQNPIGRWMIVSANGQVFCFVITKLVGTTTVCTAIIAMLHAWPGKAVAVSSVLACLQVVLLTYLTLF